MLAFESTVSWIVREYTSPLITKEDFHLKKNTKLKLCKNSIKKLKTKNGIGPQPVAWCAMLATDSTVSWN
jgi:hypothetical protein